MRWSRFVFFSAFGAAFGADCSFNTAPEEFLSVQTRVHADIAERLRKLSPVHAATVSAANVPRRNFVDEQIFGKMDAAGVESAPLTTDEEFVRRVTLDITGRIP